MLQEKEFTSNIVIFLLTKHFSICEKAKRMHTCKRGAAIFDEHTIKIKMQDRALFSFNKSLFSNYTKNIIFKREKSTRDNTTIRILTFITLKITQFL